MPDYDLIIVGGGPAGLSTALHLHKNHPALAARTLVLERDQYPREKYCAGGLGGRGVNLLARLGIGIDVPHVALSGVTIRLPNASIAVREPGFGCVVRRIEFDHSLARAVMARGLALRQGAKVEGVTETADGVKVSLATGETLTARAVVGADGVGGAVRKSAGFAGGRLRAQVVELDTERIEGDPPHDEILFDLEDQTLGGYAWDFPTLVGGRELICRGVYLIRPLGADNVHARLSAWMARRGLDSRRYKLKPFGERGIDPNELLSKPRVLLSGEAAGIDIATGEGIAQALQYGAVTARYLGAAFAKNDLTFVDWTRYLHRSKLGLSLGARLLAWRVFYFHRADAAALFQRCPALLQIYAEEFSGNGVRPSTVARLLRQASPRDVPWSLRAAFTDRERAPNPAVPAPE